MKSTSVLLSTDSPQNRLIIIEKNILVFVGKEGKILHVPLFFPNFPQMFRFHYPLAPPPLTNN